MTFREDPKNQPILLSSEGRHKKVFILRKKNIAKRFPSDENDKKIKKMKTFIVSFLSKTGGNVFLEEGIYDAVDSRRHRKKQRRMKVRWCA